MKPKTRISLHLRRTGIVIHLIIIFALGTLFLLYPGYISNIVFLSVLIPLFIILLLSFKLIVWDTGIWNLTHRNEKNMDEREYTEVLNSIRLSYSAYSIITVICFYLISILELKFLVPLAACFLYLAHILPACFLGWKLKEI